VTEANTDSADGDIALSADSITVIFGGVRALSGVDLKVRAGHVAGLIGPNGAGKTTLLNCIARLQPLNAGTLSFNGVDLLQKKASGLARLGMSRTFQHAMLSPDLSVFDNVLIGAHARSRSSVAAGVLGLPSARREAAVARDHVADLLAALDLTRYAGRLATSLPTPLQKRVDIARALASSPRLIVMDEPAAGLNETDVSELTELIQRFRNEFGVTSTLLVEHNVGMVMKVCDMITVLSFGERIAVGPPESVRIDPRVIEAYLGGEVAA
jgi:branched-chain amino acid transport system ATP-binding protein